MEPDGILSRFRFQLTQGDLDYLDIRVKTIDLAMGPLLIDFSLPSILAQYKPQFDAAGKKHMA